MLFAACVSRATICGRWMAVRPGADPQRAEPPRRCVKRDCAQGKAHFAALRMLPRLLPISPCCGRVLRLLVFVPFYTNRVSCPETMLLQALRVLSRAGILHRHSRAPAVLHPPYAHPFCRSGRRPATCGVAQHWAHSRSAPTGRQVVSNSASQVYRRQCALDGARLLARGAARPSAAALCKNSLSQSIAVSVCRSTVDPGFVKSAARLCRS